MEDNKSLLLKGAMSYGLAMGLFWVIKYLFLIFSISMPSLIFIYIILTLAVPVVAFNLTKLYKKDIGGEISFFHAWRFGTMLYFFAALIMSIEYFIYFQFIADPDFMHNSIQGYIKMMGEANANPTIMEALESISQMNYSAIHIAIQSIFNNIFWGILFSIPVAALVCRSKSDKTVKGAGF